MRISDWSSDVCSSDLPLHHRFAAVPLPVPGRNLMSAICRDATFLGANPFAHYIRPMTNFRLHQPGIVVAGRVAQALALALRPHSIAPPTRSEEHTSQLQSLMRISYAVICLHK